MSFRHKQTITTSCARTTTFPLGRTNSLRCSSASRHAVLLTASQSVGGRTLLTIYRDHDMVCKLSSEILQVQSFQRCNMPGCSTWQSECWMQAYAVLDDRCTLWIRPMRSKDSCPSAWILTMGDYVNTSENEWVYWVMTWSEGQVPEAGEVQSIMYIAIVIQ